MKRFVLWSFNLLVLMTLSATYAAQGGQAPQALALAELDTVTAGICRTCKPPPPPSGPARPTQGKEVWEAWNSQTSSTVSSGRTPIGTYVNSTGNTPITHSFSFNDECQYRITGGSVSLGTSLGISLNTTYNCARTHNYSFTVPPKTSVTLYKSIMTYYVTTNYRMVIVYSDGYREQTGLTDSTRTEYSYAALSIE